MASRVIWLSNRHCHHTDMIFIVFGSVLQASGAGESLIRLVCPNRLERAVDRSRSEKLKRNVRHHVGQ